MEDSITYTCSSCGTEITISLDVFDVTEDLSCPICQEPVYTGARVGRTPGGWYGGWEDEDDDEDDGDDDVDDEDGYPWVWPGAPIPGSGSGGRGKVAGLRQEVPRYAKDKARHTTASRA